MKSFNLLRIGLTALALPAFAIARGADLKIGDPAPRLKTARWLKGTPVPKFEKGKVYVLEFWATWCGPCKAAMPHLSQVAKKFAGKATIIGVNIWEDLHAEPGQNLDAKVDRFMKGVGGSTMAYNVCASSKDGYMTKNWMAAAGQGGIPATFVVDQNSRIAWIGHPVNLEEPLSKIVNGTFDAKAFAADFEKRRQESDAREKAYAEAMAPIKAAMEKKDYAEAAAAADRAMEKDPPMRMAYAISKFEALMHDPEKAYAEALRVRDDWDQAYMAAQQFVMKDALDSKFYQYAVDLGQERLRQKPEDKVKLSLVAKAYAQLKNYAKAVEYQTQFLDWAKTMNIDPTNLKDITDELEKYKSAKP